MAMDMGALLASTVPSQAHRAQEMRIPNFLGRMRAGAAILWAEYGEDVYGQAARWSSDTVRGWVAFSIPMTSRPIATQLALGQGFAADPHFAVREWAWLSLRPIVAAHLDVAIAELERFAEDPDPRVRRFASEVIRPRGVWSTHITLLKDEPGLALPILDRLINDRNRYVQDSVANWLNDASKSQPAWVTQHLECWHTRYGDDIAYVRRRALRTLRRGQSQV